MKNRVGIFAASSIVPVAEFNLGMVILKDQGFEVTIDPRVMAKHFIYPGTDDERATALYEFACDDKTDILWAARGGYGAGRLMPILDRLTLERGKPKQKKLIVGYSDVTVLHEFARRRWGFSTLHASMPAGLSFAQMIADESKAMFACARGEKTAFPWEKAKMNFIGAAPRSEVRGEIVGGNLSLWQCVVGTPYAGDAKGKILFLEDVDERPYRIDRMMQQVEQSGGLDGAKAIVLGDFTNCDDEGNMCIKPLDAGEDPRKILENVDKRERIPLRKEFPLDEAMIEIFAELGKRHGIPIARGLPVGHGPNYAPLPLGAEYVLSADGMLKMVRWDWFA
jgi:muramoyltetrapeptide carboxypeptidase